MSDHEDDKMVPEPESPRPSPHPPQSKRQLSEAQKAGLAKAREKARQSKLAKTQAKKEERDMLEQQLAEMRARQAQGKTSAQSDDDMQSSEEEEPSPPPKHKKGKKHRMVKKQRKYDSTSSESEDDPVDAAQRAKQHVDLAKAAYQNNMSRYRNDIMYKSIFPWL